MAGNKKRGSVHLVGREEAAEKNAPEAEQAELPGIPAPEKKAVAEPPPPPKQVRDGAILCQFVKPHHYMDEEMRFIELEMSFPLTEDHRDLLPDAVIANWDHILSGNVKRIDVIGIEPHNFIVSLSPDKDARDLEIDNAAIDKASLSLVETSGSGADQDVIRFLFRIVTELTPENNKFVGFQYNKQVWLRMEPVQTKLKLKK